MGYAIAKDRPISPKQANSRIKGYAHKTSSAQNGLTAEVKNIRHEPRAMPIRPKRAYKIKLDEIEKLLGNI